MSIDIILVLTFSVLFTTIAFFVRQCGVTRAQQEKIDNYRTGACLAVGKLARGEPSANVFMAIETYSPKEDKELLNSIFDKEK